jgi:hypothetical protein
MYSATAYGSTWRAALCAVLLLITLAAGPAAADEEKPAVELAVSAMSKYVWRGQELSRNSIVLEPSVTAGYKSFTANVWGNIDTRPYGAAGQDYSSTWTETDLTLSYARSFGPVTAGIGYIYYGLAAPNKDAAAPPDSQELFVTVGLDTLFAPTLTVYREIDHYHQWYFLFGLSHTIPLGTAVGLKLSASASWLKSTDASTYPLYNDRALPTGGKFDALHDGVLSACLPVKPSRWLTVTPSLAYAFPLSRDARNEMKGRGIAGTARPEDRDSSFVFGGLSVAVSF